MWRGREAGTAEGEATNEMHAMLLACEAHRTENRLTVDGRQAPTMPDIKKDWPHHRKCRIEPDWFLKYYKNEILSLAHKCETKGARSHRKA